MAYWLANALDIHGQLSLCVRCQLWENIALSKVKGEGSPYSITERRVPELIPVLGSQPAGVMSHEPGDRLPLLSARPTVTPAILNRELLPILVHGEQRHEGCEQFA